MSNLKCIIHYENQVSYSEIKSLTETNLRRISEAREKRNELCGKNNHLEQIKQIPEKIDPELHGVHLEPCYKRYWCLVLMEIKLKTIIQIKEMSSHVRCVESNSTIPENDWRWAIFTKVNNSKLWIFAQFFKSHSLDFECFS